ncbi:uncharacterized protein FIBRA_00999 [Fibroporia radiculosa]|uniref:Uncharacterized protein n=1 Tax=Fibroporia radiculosa TaxID=599839 RepID=J4I889_9APHY|nr:uncharacterized protein FIBRA_00999 [Fibroporia radiculosa]CCL98991.1 predicted protein [Fibroporia radiculosa]
MGKAQKKTGKGRLDKYYKLAKEQGYRARSAFKLIQLNKKYSFLESARCCIDLCAAPGGWLQVASKYMPVNSVIVGVDLVSIKPIPHVITFASDITTPQCRNLIRAELKDWKADVVLHDGAPNVGTAWVQDAYGQSELVLMSMKLAAEFLIKGGTFVTKVFRSVDYNNLIWVFNQLFGKVEATKPPSSRNVSAEIFVVCRDFLAPKHIDPKFFDPKHVFKDLSVSASTSELSSKNHQVTVFQPEKKRRHRDGYDDGDYILFKKTGAAEFIRSQDPIAVLGSVNKITFETEEEKDWLKLDITTSDITENCGDLKVLGKGDFKALLKWRTSLREEVGLEVKTMPSEELTETVEITEELDEEAAIQNEACGTNKYSLSLADGILRQLERLNSEAVARAKRDRRRANEIKTRTIQRMQLQMTAPLDIGMEHNDAALKYGQEDVFELGGVAKAMKGRNGATALADVDDASTDDDPEEASSNEEGDELMDSDEEQGRQISHLEAELDGLYDAYRDRLRERDAKYKVKEARKNNKNREEWHGIQEAHSDDDDDSEGEGGWENLEQAKERMGEDSSSDENSDEEENGPVVTKRKRPSTENVRTDAHDHKKARTITQADMPAEAPHLSRAAQVWFSQDCFAGADIDVEDDPSEQTDATDEDDEAESLHSDPGQSSSENDNDFEEVPQDVDGDVDMWDVENENLDELKDAKIRNHGLLTAEAVTIAQQLVNREKTRTQLVNDGFNRYSLNAKDDLPSWFLDDEDKHYKANIPVTKEAIAALRAKMRALDARPIKKVAEAKARKKFKAAQRLEKAMKKADGVNDTADMTEREKAKQIEKLMQKGMAKSKKKEVKVVVAKGSHKGVKGRPKGVKGRYVMVDSRMKKELRAKKRQEKAAKRR